MFRMGICCLVFVSILISCSNKYTIIEEKCGRCHKSENVYKKKRDMDEWKRIIYAMKLRGLQLNENEEKELFETLKEKKLILDENLY